jgi:hypothetical protein
VSLLGEQDQALPARRKYLYTARLWRSSHVGVSVVPLLCTCRVPVLPLECMALGLPHRAGDRWQRLMW